MAPDGLPHPSEVNMMHVRSSRGWFSTLGAAGLLALASPSPSLHAQQGSQGSQAATIAGTVKSESGQPIENANAYIKEMNISVGTNAQGRYSIVIPAERVRGQSVTLSVRAIAHLAQTKPITIRAGTQTVDFEMQRDINRLQEVVVTGVTAGTEQKKTTFTVSSLNAEQDLQVPATNALQELAAKVPGASVVQSSGRPGSAPSVMLRGPRSINASGRSQEPLVLVDGIILNGNTTDIDPEDIESIEVVKGAAASSLYGSRAGNGIISITTKSAKNSSPGLHINARQEQGFSSVNGNYRFAKDHMLIMSEDNTRFCIKQSGLPMCSRTVDLLQEAYRINDQGGDASLTPYLFERDFGIANAATKPELKGLFMANQWPVMWNPIDQAATNNPYYSSTLDLNGRAGSTGYYASFNNLANQGAIKFLQGYRRQSARVNVDQKMGDNFDTQINTYFQRSQTYPDGNWFNLTRQHPNTNLLATDSKGRLFIRPDPTAETSQNYNPLYDNATIYGVTRADRFLGSMTNRYDMTPWLTFDATTAYDSRRASGVDQSDKGYRTTVVGPANSGQIGARSDYGVSYNVALGATATHGFGRDLMSRVNLRYTYDDQEAQTDSASGNTLAVPGLLTLTNATTSLTPYYIQSSVKAIGASAGLNLEYKERYIFDGAVRNDGSSLFGAAQRWHSYHRESFAWRASEEPWFPAKDIFNDVKFRAAVGTAGGRPRFDAQYEAFTIGTGGAITATTLGNKNLRPETTLETEYGIDAEFFHRYGLNLTYARDITTDEILQVPPSVSSGFSSQWLNAGTMDGKTWEASLNVPLITRRNLVWTSRVNWDQSIAHITQMNVPAFFQSTDGASIKYAVGERYGDVYGKQFVTQCSQLPADFAAQCGPGQEWQKNDEGYVVWVGKGNSPDQGITNNLWQAVRPGCIVNGVGRTDITGAINCLKAGGKVNNPWGQPVVNWGMIQVMRDSSANPALQMLGNGQPLWKASWAQNLQYKRINLYVLLDKTYGRHVFNEDRHWSLGDFMTADEDQLGKSVGSAKPIGYYWRAPAPDNAAGVGGFYDVLGANSLTYEDATFMKLREVSGAFNIGRVPKLAGDWTISFVGRNLYTWTRYTGWDPDIGDTSNSNANSGAIVGVQAYQYPPTRQFTITLSSKF
jgi:TonB-linked SusC/RagA family outer membrane protein